MGAIRSFTAAAASLPKRRSQPQTFLDRERDLAGKDTTKEINLRSTLKAGSHGNAGQSWVV
jgi:hypothetical protein